MTIDILAVGHTAFDYIMQVEDFPSPNSSVKVEKLENLHGGAAANVAVAVQKLGFKSGLVSAVGEDFKKTEYYEKLKKMNINMEGIIEIENYKTPRAFVVTNSKNDQISYFYWGAAEKFEDLDPPKEVIKKAKIIHLATGNPKFNIRCGKIAKKYNKIVSADPGQDLYLYSSKNLKEMLSTCDILFGNHHEIRKIKKKTNEKDLRKLGPKIVVETYGKEGSIIHSKNMIKIKALGRKVVDPTGAGDSYRAGFLVSYLKGNDLETCGKICNNSSIVCNRV